MLIRQNNLGSPRSPHENKEAQPLNQNIDPEERYLISSFTFGGEIVARRGIEVPYFRPLPGFIITPAVIDKASSRLGEIKNQDISDIANHLLSAFEAKDINDKKFAALLSHDIDYDKSLFIGIKSYSLAVFQFSANEPLNVIFPEVLSNLIMDYTSDTPATSPYPGDLRRLTVESSPVDKMPNCVTDMSNCIKIIFSKTIVMDPLYPQMLSFIMEDLYAIQKIRSDLINIIEDLINKRDTFYDPQIIALRKILDTPIFPKIRLTTTQSDRPSIEEAKLSALSVACRLSEFIGIIGKQIIDVSISLCSKSSGKSSSCSLFRASPKKLPREIKDLLGKLLMSLPDYIERKKQINKMSHFFTAINSSYLEDAKSQVESKPRLKK